MTCVGGWVLEAPD
ncbi:hypothetical protein MP638_004024, partial [Amoeboaphelidium occidentale]